MPPRYAYWTILIDDKPTAFRARDKAELLPTLQQLKRTNPNALMKWFARGKLWDTPEQAQWASKHLPKQAEHRGRDWRPGGEHRDHRDRRDQRARFQQRPDRPAKDVRSPSPPKFERRPLAERPGERHRRPENRPGWSGKPTDRKPTDRKPTDRKPTGWKPTGWKATGWKPSGRPGAKPASMKFRKPWRRDERQAKGDERKRRDDAFEKPPVAPNAKPKPPERR
jgi:hypothetical protein